jgi:hypothetical protein
MTTSITFFDGFATRQNDNNCHSLFRWFYCEEGDDNNIYGGGVVKKAMATCHCLLSFFLFLLLWSFWSSSLKLKINNEMVVFFNVESCNG